MLETKLDVRDGMAWNQFDKALEKLEGGVENDELEESVAGESDEEATEAGRTVSPSDVLRTIAWREQRQPHSVSDSCILELEFL